MKNTDGHALVDATRETQHRFVKAQIEQKIPHGCGGCRNNPDHAHLCCRLVQNEGGTGYEDRQTDDFEHRCVADTVHKTAHFL
ncbi:hypothetical protein D3C80_1960740 [compost metagenome]